MNGAKQYKAEAHGGRTVELVAVSCELPALRWAVLLVLCSEGPFAGSHQWWCLSCTEV